MFSRDLDRLFAVVLLLSSMQVIGGLTDAEQGGAEVASSDVHMSSVIIEGGLYLFGLFLVSMRWRRVLSAARAVWPWLCILPAIKSVHAFLTDTLTGANYQWQRSLSDIARAVFNVLVNLWIIRAYAWRGAAWSSLMTASLLVVLLYMIIRWHLRRERLAATATTTARPIFAAGGE